MIIFPFEVDRYSITKGKFSGEEFAPYVKLGTDTALNSLSSEFRKKLEECANEDYFNASVYNPNEEYNEGDYIIYNDVIYVSPTDENKSCPPCGWDEACRFDCEDCCEAWECWIGLYVALYISKLATLGTSYQYTAQGILKQIPDRAIAVDKDEMGAAIANIDSLIYITKENIINAVWYEKNKCLEILKKCIPCPPKTCDDCNINKDTNNNYAFGVWSSGYKKCGR